MVSVATGTAPPRMSGKPLQNRCRRSGRSRHDRENFDPCSAVWDKSELRRKFSGSGSRIFRERDQRTGFPAGRTVQQENFSDKNGPFRPLFPTHVPRGGRVKHRANFRCPMSRFDQEPRSGAIPKLRAIEGKPGIFFRPAIRAVEQGPSAPLAMSRAMAAIPESIVLHPCLRVSRSCRKGSGQVPRCRRQQSRWRGPGSPFEAFRRGRRKDAGFWPSKSGGGGSMTRTVSQIRVQVFPAWLWLGNPGTDARVRGTLEALLAGLAQSVWSVPTMSELQREENDEFRCVR